MSEEGAASPATMSKEGAAFPAIMSEEGAAFPAIMSEEGAASPAIMSEEGAASPAIMSKEDAASPVVNAILAASFSASIPAQDWNDRMRAAVMGIAGLIPQVGKVAGVIIGIFWPQNKIDIFEALKKDIEILIEKKILEYELNERANELEGLRSVIDRYDKAMINEKAGFLTSWIVQADNLSISVRRSINDVHLILLAVTVAMLHLTALRERFDHGKELYGEDNTKVWQKDLEDMYSIYEIYFPDIFAKWKSWRADQVEIKSWVERRPSTIPPFFWPDTYQTVEDKVSGEKIQYVNPERDRVGAFDQIANAQKARMVNEASTDMAGCIWPTFSYNRFLPGKEKDPSVWHNVFSKMFLGPYSQDLAYKDYKGNSDRLRLASTNRDDYQGSSGPIKKLIIREWNTIDAMQFIYANRNGSMSGNANGGKEHVVGVENKIVSGFRMGFSNGVLTYVQILYGDGTKSDTFGNRGGWRCYEFIAQAPDGYKLTSWSYRDLSGPSNTFGPGVLQFQYEPTVSQAA